MCGLTDQLEGVRLALMAHFEGTIPLTRGEACAHAVRIEDVQRQISETTVFNQPAGRVLRLVPKEPAE